MNRSVQKAYQRARFATSTVGAPQFKGALVTRDEKARINAWLRARGLLSERHCWNRRGQ